MPKAIAIAITQNPLSQAFASLKNTLMLLADFMYGTPERTKFTYAFAFGMILLGAILNGMNDSSLASCAL